MNRLLILLFLPVIIGGCEQSSDCCVYPYYYEPLLPLDIGNSWELKRTTELGEQSVAVTLRKTIDAQVALDDVSYYRMITLTELPDVTTRDTAYYRTDANSYIFVRYGSTAAELNEFRVLAQPGDTWPYREGDMKLTKIDKEFLPTVTLENCRYFYYDVPEMADEELLFVLSPRVGFVKMVNAMGTFELKKAVINGKTQIY